MVGGVKGWAPICGGSVLWWGRTPISGVGFVGGICSGWEVMWLRLDAVKGGFKVEEFFVKFFKSDRGISSLDSSD